MKRSLEKIFKVFFIIIVITALAAPRTVLAQDTLPTDAPAAATEVVSTDVPTDAPVVEETAAPATEVATEAATAETVVDEPAAPTEAPVVEETVADVVDAMVDAEIVLVDENGNPISMASNAAADAIASDDPWFQNPTDASHVEVYQSSCATWVFTTAKYPGYSGGTCHATTTPIQSAIDAAPDGSTIHLEAATFQEQVDIDNRNLTLVGAGTSTILNGPSTLVQSNGSGDSYGYANYYAMFYIHNGSYINLSNMLFNGSTISTVPYDTVFGALLIQNSSVNLSGVTIQNFDNSSSHRTGTGILVNGVTGSDEFNINNSNIINNEVGIYNIGNSNQLFGASNYFRYNDHDTYNATIVSDSKKMTICHWDNGTRQYSTRTVSVNSTIKTSNCTLKNGGHGGHALDIIPAYSCSSGHTFAGQGDQDIFANGCKVPVPGLTIEKTVSEPNFSKVNDTLHYSYKVTNSGQSTIKGPITVSDNKVTVTCPSTSTLAIGSHIHCSATYHVTALDVTNGYVTNIASAQGFYAGNVVNSPTDTVTVNKKFVAEPKLTLTKNATETGYSAVGDQLHYTYIVTNSGNVAVTNVSVSDDKTTVTCPKTSLAVNESMTCTATYTITAWVLSHYDSVTNEAQAIAKYSCDKDDDLRSCVETSCEVKSDKVHKTVWENCPEGQYRNTDGVCVNKTELVITASSPTIDYGTMVPAITASYSTGSMPVTMTTPPTCVSSVTGIQPAGTYSLVTSCSGAVDPNYHITYVRGTVTVNKVPLVITASDETMTYGGIVPTISPSYSGWVNSEGVGVLTSLPTCSTLATSTSTVAGSPYASSCIGAAAANYTISYLDGSVTVDPAPLTITASGGSFVYGGTLPTITPSYAGWVNGEDETTALLTLPTCSLPVTLTNLADVVDNPFVSYCNGAVARNGNYEITYKTGLVDETPAPLTITASSGAMFVGGTVPTITPSYTGLVPGGIIPLPVCSTIATSASPAGTYPSSCVVAPYLDEDFNYDITYVDGVVTVFAISVPPPGPTPALAVPVTGGALIPVTGGTLIVSGLGHSCMTYANGQVICWGLNASGQLGDGTTVNKSEPVYVKDLTGVLNLTAGGKHTCALTIDGEIWCWGENSSGQLGNGSTTNSSVPVKVTGLPDKVLSITAGEEFTCAQLMNQEVWCWGKNNLGQLNDGTTTNQSSPVKSKLTALLAQISGGQGLLLGSDVLGSVNEWAKVQAAAVKQLASSLSISANRWGDTGCAVAADGSVKCWGSDLTSTAVAGAMTAMEVGTGLDHNCSINTDESVSCWGSNASGQLGNGTNTDSAAATLVKNLALAHALAVGAHHTCVLSGAGNTAMCWGENTYGQLGNNSTANSNVPVLVVLPK